MVASTSPIVAVPIVVGSLGLFEGPCGWVISLGLIRPLKRRFHRVTGIPGDLASELHHRYRLSGGADRVASGLSASAMWRVDSSPPVMVRVSEQWPPFDQVQRSCAVAASFARVLPQVPAPLAARDGTATFLWHGHPVVVWPLIDGYRQDRNDPTQRRLAAQLLAELHRAALHSGHPNTDASDETYATRPTGPGPSGVPADPELDDWIGRWRDQRRIDEPRGWMHGDFFPRNILCSSSYEVAGLVDWDDAQHGPLITELASTTWEFACTADRDTLAIDSARDFLNSYAQAGGPVQPGQDIVPLIRVRLRSSITFFRRLQAHGHHVNPDNERASIAAFTALRHLTLTV